MTKSQARIEAEIKANEFTTERMGQSLHEFTQLEQIAFIQNEDARVITNEEKELLER